MSIEIINNTNTRMVFSVFNQGDNFVPYEAKWIEADTTGNLGTGNFKSVGVGAQVQNGGVWIGGDPSNAPYATPGQTVTFTISKVIS